MFRVTNPPNKITITLEKNVALYSDIELCSALKRIYIQFCFLDLAFIFLACKFHLLRRLG